MEIWMKAKDHIHRLLVFFLAPWVDFKPVCIRHEGKACHRPYPHIKLHPLAMGLETCL